MSRVPKWKIEKTKVKVVFRLQFHATNIPSTGWDKLFLSFISADTGKVTAKTNKTNVRNGSCKWPDPIYEATRLLQDPRTKTYDDKLYKLVVAMGTSRSSILGEIDVNLAEFSEALKPASITLPLRGCDFGTLLHVTAQLLTTKTGFREFEQQRETGARSSQQLLNQRSHDPAEVAVASSDISADKVNARIKLKETSLGFPLVDDSAGSTEDYENSSHTSDGIFAEKNDPYSGHEISSFRSSLSGDLPLCPASQSPTPEKGARWGKHLSPQGSNDWTHGWSTEYSGDKDLAAGHEDNTRLRTRLEVAESAFSQLKTEATSLEHVTDKLGTETQGLAKQLAVELMSRNQLTTEVSLLRTECSNLKRELEEIKSSKLLQQGSDADVNSLSNFGNDGFTSGTSVHDLQTEWLQGLLLLESKLQQTRNNALHGLQASDLDFLLADLGALQRVIENLKKGAQPGQMKENRYVEHLGPPSSAAHLLTSGRDHDTLKKSSGGNTGTMEEKMCELLQKLEDSKTEKENLLEKMSQMERYYESFIHKIEESQKQTAIELENLRKEHNSCFYTVSVLQAQKQKMHEEMNDQLMRFVEDRTALEAQNKELERRAVATETALKRVRFNYSAAVERLQKDLELLSFQVLSMYESNETLAKQTFLEDYESLAEEHSAVADFCENKEQGQYSPDVKQIGPEGLYAETKPQVFFAENSTLDKMDGQKNLLGARRIEELRARSEYQIISNADSQGNHSNTERPKRASSTVEAELLEIFVAKIEWQIFSDVLQESHYTALDVVKCMQGRLHMLEKQLQDSSDARQSLVVKLNSALDQVKSVKESEAECILKCDDLTVKNQILEAKLHDITVDNALFMEKLTESERLIQEHKSCESKYKACVEERKKLENLLMKESLQTEQLKDELRSVKENFEAMKDELDRKSSLNNDMRIVLTSLQDQLGDLCSKIVSFKKQFNISGLDEASLLNELQSKDYTALMANLAFFQQQMCKEVLQFRQEKEVVEEMCDALQKRSETAESELLDMKRKFACDLDATKESLNLSEELVEKLQQDLQNMAHKLKISSDSQEKQTSKLSQVEVELQNVTSENEVLGEKLKEYDATVEELKRAKISLTEHEEDNRTLTLSLQSKDESLMHMESKIRCLKDDLRFTGENLLKEKKLKEELESALASLTSQLGEKDQVLHSFDEHKIELIHLRDQVSDMEKANSIIQDALSQSEQIQRDHNYKNCSLQSHLSNVENQLETVLGDMLSSEIEATYMRSQVREAVMQLDLLRNDLEKLQFKNKYADQLLRAHMSAEAELADRNATLQAAIHSLEIDLCRVIKEKEGLEGHMKENMEPLTLISNKSRDTSVSIGNSERVLKHKNEISELIIFTTDLEEQVDDVLSTNEEIEILNMILRSKLEEQHTVMSSLLQNQGHELKQLKDQNKDLTQKLAEQSLKAEEFKNLSIHLRELKEKAEAGRKEKEGSLFAMQDSLRIAFIKEQCESKVQELKGQVSVSKKHAEDMLLKLQSALDEVETGRKNEIALAKRIEELSMKVSEMEVEMQDLSAEKRELSNAYDNMMTELECTKLNLDCCREEKKKFEVSLHECNEERDRIRVELDLVKRLLENMSLTDNNTSHDSPGSCKPGTTSIGCIMGDGNSDSASKVTPNSTEMDSGLQEGKIQSTSLSSNLSHGTEDTGKFGELECINCTACKNIENCDRKFVPSMENHSNENDTFKDISKGHKKLATDLNLFQKELERLKNDNLSPLLPLDINLIDPSLSGLERTLSQLDMANEHLQSIFPSFKELSGSGNALERVLALELELAEALQAKKKTDILFQSSFLKQHNDEAAVFQSFRDINELIQDTIELKRRQVAVENELKEMQGRYSELSVQFAEVEGERQKLEMHLKNRTPR